MIQFFATQIKWELWGLLRKHVLPPIGFWLWRNKRRILMGLILIVIGLIALDQLWWLGN